MLRTRVQRATGNTGVLLTVTHGLGASIEFWAICPVSNRFAGTTQSFYTPAANLPTANVLFVVHSLASVVTLDVVCIAYQGRLY